MRGPGRYFRTAVLGIGRQGNNVIDHMVSRGMQGIEFVAIDTDARALAHSRATTQVCIEANTFAGISCSNEPAIGTKAAQESEAELFTLLNGLDLAFVCLGIDDAIGSAGGPMVARIAREVGALTIAAIIEPYSLTYGHQDEYLQRRTANVRKQVDGLMVASHRVLLSQLGTQASTEPYSQLANELLSRGVQGIWELISIPGLITLDLTDLRGIVEGSGKIFTVGVGHGEGESKSAAAAKTAIDSLMQDTAWGTVGDIMFAVTGGPDLTLYDVNEAAEAIRRFANPDADIIFGAIIDESLTDTLQLTLVVARSGSDGSSVGPDTHPGRFRDNSHFGGIGA